MPGSDPQYVDLRPSCRRELTALITIRSKPGMIISDHGTEFTSNAILTRPEDHKVEWHTAPGKPMRNGFVESFDGRTRDAGRSDAQSFSGEVLQ